MVRKGDRVKVDIHVLLLLESGSRSCSGSIVIIIGVSSSDVIHKFLSSDYIYRCPVLV